MTNAQAVASYLREAAFTTLNRFVALKMLEARGLVQECVSRGEESTGFREYMGLAPGLVQLPDRGYRLYLESLFDEVGSEVGILFDRRDPSGFLWPRRQALAELLATLNEPRLAGTWDEDETIGWVYQYFNSDKDRERARYDAAGKPKAPQNGYELAVRNQFFTPRYVVRFLTDNTLGRTWFQMRNGQTALADACEFLVQNEDAAAPREQKDPRDLRILDPACGSGHFLLYAFDLLLRIYEEAWEDAKSPTCTSTGRRLRDDYPEVEGLQRALPALILRHNLYGVEIDPRAAQIAALALWLRAQRAYRTYAVPPRERGTIKRTHIVVAEPMPGDKSLAEEFAAVLEPPLLADLFVRMVEEMQLAGELGPLLRVNEALAAALGDAREAFLDQAKTTAPLPGMEETAHPGEVDVSQIDDKRFFAEAEDRLFDALSTYAGSTSGSAGVRRRLFAEDAEQGIAFIDLIRRKFDVVLMNPPFGAGSVGAKKKFDRDYPRTRNDLYAAFVERGIELLTTRGMLGAITSRTGFFLSSFQRWREEVILNEAPPVVFADLGYGVLDSAMVEVAAYCLEAES